MRETTSHLGLYRAHLTSPEHRRKITVARKKLVEDTLDVLRGSMSRKSKRHFLFIGPRGIGKTHLLSLVKDEIATDEELSSHYVVARFPEESNRVLSFADFLIRLCEILRDELPEETEWMNLYESLHTEEDDSLIVDQLVPHLRRTNQEKKRTILVMLENLHELFARQIKNKKDLGAMRKFFMDANGCLLMATAPLHFDAITNVKEPFFDFFDTQILDNLTEEETIELIRLNLEWDDKKELLATFDDLRPKLLSLYRMTGGNPRLTVMLYELIAHDSITKVRQQFEILLDRISPFYQDRLNDLPPQERAVLETMATMRDQEKTPASIAEQMRMSQPQTSALLKRLTEARYIRSTPDPKDGRRRLYNIREGFFDIWLGMNLSRGARKRIPYLLDFFTLFYPSLEERREKRRQLLEKYGGDEGFAPDAQAVLDHLSEIGDPEERAHAKLELARLRATAGEEGDAGLYLEEARALSLDKVGRWIVDHAEASTDYLTEIEEMIECWDEHRSGDLEKFAERLIGLGQTLTYKSYSETKIDFLRDHLEEINDPEKRITVRLWIARILKELARWKEAESQLTAARDEILPNSDKKSTVLNNLALLLQDTNRLKEAEPLMKEALDIDRASFGDQHPHVARNLNNLATLLKATNRLKEAEPLMKEALDIDRASFGNQHPNVAIDLNNLALLLKDTNRLKEAEALMREALDIDRASFGDQHPNVARNLNNLALLLKATNRFKEAEPLMREALSILHLFWKATGFEHPNWTTAKENYRGLLEELKWEGEEIDRAVSPFRLPEEKHEQ
ncbi:MAG: tetratricopeptide repeat protein [Verrucomicrobiota bacterium]